MRRAVRALALAAALASVPARAAGPAPAIEDDVTRAFAVAREQSALLLVDVWAPW